MGEDKTIRIKTKNGPQNVNIDIQQDFDYLEVLSLRILQKDAYRIFCSDYGVLIGKVLANGGFPIPNAKISIFIALDAEDAKNEEVVSVYPFNTPQDTLFSGKRYNLLPRDQQYNTPVTHSPVGTFPSKYDIMTNKTLKYVHEKYYKYTTTTNKNGDYMFFGIPSGTHVIHMDIDLSDIGTNSVTPADLINLGYSPYLFESTTQFRTSNDFDQLAQIVGQNQTTFINPFWGDPDQCSFGITRLDFSTSRFVYPKGYFIGSVYTDGKPTDPNSFVPRSCWQRNANTAMNPDGFPYGVSRIVRASTLRSSRQIVENSEVYGHKAIIEAVRINDETREPEYVGQWETDLDGNFLIPLPLNRGKKAWDENEQGWVESEDGFFTYADYRFKIYFEGQGDSGAGGRPEYQFDGYSDIETITDDNGNATIKYDHTFTDSAKTNRGVIFAPNPNLWDDSNHYAFYAKPSWQTSDGYEYNMDDQFGNAVGHFKNYARIRLGSYYTTEQIFNLKADFDSAIRGTDEDFDQKWYNGTNDLYYGTCDDCYVGTPVFKDWSVGTNPWIIMSAYMNPNEGKNQFPINYLFGRYLMKSPSVQEAENNVNLSQNGGFVSNWINDPMIEGSFGPAYGESNDQGPNDYQYSPPPSFTTNAGGYTEPLEDAANGCCTDSDPDGGSGTVQNNAVNMTSSATNAFITNASNFDNCVGCISLNTFGIGGQIEGAFNEDTGPYGYNYQTPGTNTPYDVTIVDPNFGLNGNAGYGGFIAPVAGVYRIHTAIAYCGAKDTFWASAGFAICDTTSVDCSDDQNWTYSGRTTVVGKTSKPKEQAGWVDFLAPGSTTFPWNTTKFNNGVGLEDWRLTNGQMSWDLPMKEGQAIKLLVRASKTDADAGGPYANANNSGRLSVIHWAYNSTPDPDGGTYPNHVTSMNITKLKYNGKSKTTDRWTNEGIVGSLYFPQYYLGGDENQSCSRANGDFETAADVSAQARQYNWKLYSLLATGSWVSGGNYNEKLVEDWGGDPKGGMPIPNSKYYNVNTIGTTDVVEITKNIPDFRLGANQWATIDPYLPETSADQSQETFNLNDSDYEDFSTNQPSPAEGRKFLQKKQFAPFDNLGFRNSQQWPRELGGANWNNVLADGNLIPAGWVDWWSNWNAGTLVYPVNANLSISNWHYFRYSPTNLNNSADWKQWDTKVSPLWYGNNDFWWKNIMQIPHIGLTTSNYSNPSILPNGVLNTGTIWGNGVSFNVDKGSDTPIINAYPKRKYYYFGLYTDKTAVNIIKRILGYN